MANRRGVFVVLRHYLYCPFYLQKSKKNDNENLYVNCIVSKIRLEVP